MKKLIIITSLVLSTLSAGAELIKNGDFDDAAYWSLAVPLSYGPPPHAEVDDDTFMLKGLRATRTGYLTLNQAVEIKNGINYKLTFEAKGTSTNQYLVALHDPGIKWPLSPVLTSKESWTKEEIEFTGVFDADRKWVRDWRRSTRLAELRNG